MPKSCRTDRETSGAFDCFQVAVMATSSVPNASCRARAALAPIQAMLPAYRRVGWRGNQRQPRGIGFGRRVEIVESATNCRHRAPQAIDELAGLGRVQAVVDGDVEQCEHSRSVHERQPALAHGVARDVIPDCEVMGGRTCAVGADAGPEPGNLSSVRASWPCCRSGRGPAPRGDRWRRRRS